MPKLTRRSRAGFSIIEALIALTIAAIGLTAVLELQHQLTAGQVRYEAALKRITLRRAAMALIAGLNPEDKPTGQTELSPTLKLTWSSRAETPLRRNTGQPAGDGGFNVRLYAVTARLTDASGRLVDSFEVERLGWKRLPIPTGDL